MGEGSTITKAALLNAMIRAQRRFLAGDVEGSQYDHLYWELEDLLVGEEE